VIVTYDKHSTVRQIVADGPPIFPQTPPPDRTDASIFPFDD
jgi:hypothetical protein